MKHRRPHPKRSPACQRKAQRMAESIWWITAKHTPTRPGEPPEPWYERLLSHRQASNPHLNISRARLDARLTGRQGTMRLAMNRHLSRYRWKQRLAHDLYPRKA